MTLIKKFSVCLILHKGVEWGSSIKLYYLEFYDNLFPIRWQPS